MRALIEKKDAYKLHIPVRKGFACNPYTENNMMYAWVCDLLVVQAYAKYNDSYRYILSVTDIFPKFRPTLFEKYKVI